MTAAIATGLLTMSTAANAVDDDLTRGGVPLTAFNGLAFQYRGNANIGLKASTLNEPSVPYSEFLDRIDKGEVEFVEFMVSPGTLNFVLCALFVFARARAASANRYCISKAPSGDAAYVTFKAKDGEAKQKPIRIGEGYPIEDPEGWSSPAFVVKIVKKKDIPFKFTVAALAAYNK